MVLLLLTQVTTVGTHVTCWAFFMFHGCSYFTLAHNIMLHTLKMYNKIYQNISIFAIFQYWDLNSLLQRLHMDVFCDFFLFFSFKSFLTFFPYFTLSQHFFLKLWPLFFSQSISKLKNSNKAGWETFVR
jgi:hypothetical protein